MNIDNSFQYDIDNSQFCAATDIIPSVVGHNFKLCGNTCWFHFCMCAHSASIDRPGFEKMEFHVCFDTFPPKTVLGDDETSALFLKSSPAFVNEGQSVRNWPLAANIYGFGLSAAKCDWSHLKFTKIWTEELIRSLPHGVGLRSSVYSETSNGQ